MTPLNRGGGEYGMKTVLLIWGQEKTEVTFIFFPNFVKKHLCDK